VAFRMASGRGCCVAEQAVTVITLHIEGYLLQVSYELKIFILFISLLIILACAFDHLTLLT
jgi:hypothetical protein